mmetsp:Transcript_7798/g.35353  ORF Transcript_7798/g.35353 Transcript_7798/m.35353 type:complete len:261 (+) Transcript_7798:782-1564(+)
MHRDRDGQRRAPVGRLQRAGAGDIQDREHEGAPARARAALARGVRVCAHVPAARPGRSPRQRGAPRPPVRRQRSGGRGGTRAAVRGLLVRRVRRGRLSVQRFRRRERARGADERAGQLDGSELDGALARGWLRHDVLRQQLESPRGARREVRRREIRRREVRRREVPRRRRPRRRGRGSASVGLGRPYRGGVDGAGSERRGAALAPRVWDVAAGRFVRAAAEGGRLEDRGGGDAWRVRRGRGGGRGNGGSPRRRDGGGGG